MKKFIKTVFLIIFTAMMLVSSLYGCAAPLPTSSSSTPITVPVAESTIVAGEAPALNIKTQYTNDVLEGYHKINSDFIGIFEIPGIGLSELVVTAPDNSYYMRKDLEGNYRHEGILFFDYRCIEDGFFGFNSVLYGHNIGKSKYNEKMFGKLVKYRSGDVYLTADIFKFIAYNGYTYYFKLFTGYDTSPSSNGDPNYFVTLDFNQDKSYHYTDMRRYQHYSEFIAAAFERSDFATPDLEVEFYDKVLTLVTCVYDFDNWRYTLQAKLMHTDEVAEYLVAHPDIATPGEIIGNPKPY